MRLRVSFLRVNKAWEQNRITDEENWRVISHQIPNSIVSIEFDSKSTRITGGISRATFSALIRDKEKLIFLTILSKTWPKSTTLINYIPTVEKRIATGLNEFLD